MSLLPDHVSERLHLTSLRAERLSMVLRELSGRCLDIGAGDNMLLRLYKEREYGNQNSVGVDVCDWGGNCLIVENCRTFPFSDSFFDTVSFVACLNHIPERAEALREANRVLRPGGKVIITMIGRLVGTIGHAIWWYSEDKHRTTDAEEVMGLNAAEVRDLLIRAGFVNIKRQGFLYGLNSMYIASRA